MAKNSITDYDNTSGNNTDVQSVDISEGCSPSGINNAIREVMADLADVNDGTVALTSPQAANMTVTGTVTTDTIAENTSAAGVTIDGVLLKDGGVGSATAAITAYLSSINGGQIGGNRNLIINGSQAIAQRGASAVTVTGSAGYRTVDRFKTDIDGSGGGDFSHAQSTDVPSGQGFQYSSKFTTVTQASQPTSEGNRHQLYTLLEEQDVFHLEWGTSNAKTCTLSFWVKGSVTGTYGFIFGHYGSGGTYYYYTNYTINSANTWEKKTITVTGPTVGGNNAGGNSFGLRVEWILGVGSDAETGTLNQWTTSSTMRTAANTVYLPETSGATLYLTGVQLEVGETATPFEHRSYGDELARCQRYAQLIGLGGLGRWSSGTTAEIFYNQWTPMRSSPSATLQTTTLFMFAVGLNSGNATGCSIPFSTLNYTGGQVGITKTGGVSVSAGDIAALMENDCILLDAEL